MNVSGEEFGKRLEHALAEADAIEAAETDQRAARFLRT